MRAPRALIPLLAVCGAAAVVGFAGAGAAIEKGGGAPALDNGVEDPPEPATITAMTWDVCGDAAPGCPLGARPGELVRAVEREARGNTVGGRRVKAEAVLLQRVCSAQVTELKNSAAFKGWAWEFAPDDERGACANGQGRPGVALGGSTALGDVRKVRLPAPKGHGRAAVCATSGTWRTRLCSARFSATAEDPRGEWRRKQAAELAEAAGPGRVVFGGDLVDQPAARPLDALYRDFAECDQGPKQRDGGKTRQNWTGAAVEKTDYLFVNQEAAVSCGVPRTANRSSDHRPMTAVVTFD
nr:endonuclease/exonuclease/phosphatase family protein [Actinomadura atramentaria]